MLYIVFVKTTEVRVPQIVNLRRLFVFIMKQFNDPHNFFLSPLILFGLGLSFFIQILKNYRIFNDQFMPIL